MNSYFLQRFLYAGLLDIGDDDERLERLLKAATALEAVLYANPTQLARAAVVACDATTPPEDPLFAQVHEAVAREWSTYRNRVSTQPQQLYRAVLLEALARGAVRDDASAAVLSLVGSNLIPRTVAPEQAILREAIKALAFDKYEKVARSEWNAAIGDPPAKASQRAPTVNEKKLGEELNAAAHPNNAAGQPFPGGGNPHAPSSPQPWAAEFGTRAASAIAKAIADPIAKLHGELLTGTQQAVRNISKGVAAVARQNDVLWWKTSAYSAIADASYRELAVPLVPVAVALDLHVVAPGFTPRVLEHVMIELLRDVVREDVERKVTVGDVAEALAGNAVGTGLKVAMDGFAPGLEKGRTLLVHEMVLRVERVEESRSPSTGIGLKEPFRLGEIAVWMFRELQALRISATCASPPPESETANKKPGAVSAKDASAA